MVYDDEETVSIGRIPDEESSWAREIRISAPDVTGLGVDIFRVILDFGLRILRADISTDGTWCFLVLKVSLSPGVPARWGLLKARLLEVCPTDADALRQLCPSTPKQRRPFAVHISGHDRQGMLHSLSHALWESDVAVVKAHVSTDNGEVRDTFYVMDNRDELPEPHRVLEICDRVKGALGRDVTCVVEPAPAGMGTGFDGSQLAAFDEQRLDPTAAAASIHRLACKDAVSSANLRAVVGSRKALHPGGSSCSSEGHRHSRSSSFAVNFESTVDVDVDAAASPSHTLFTLRCKDRKGLLYDLLLNLKEVDVRLAFGKVEVEPETGECVADLYVQDSDCCRIIEEDALDELAERLREAAALPVRIEVADALEGQATELTVAANIDVGGRGRPRVTFDVTAGLCAAGVGVRCADVWQEDAAVDAAAPPYGSFPAQEIHRFLVHAPRGGGLTSAQDKHALVDVVRSCLLGTRAGTAPKWASLPGAELEGLGSSAGSSFGTGKSPVLLRSMSEAWKGS